MRLSIGLDVVHLPDFERQLADEASAFVFSAFTASERLEAESASGGAAQHLAGLWAAKEAVLKAISLCRPNLPPLLSQVDFSEIQVLQDAYGRPTVTFAGRVRAALLALGFKSVTVSISHDGPAVAAVALLELATDGGRHGEGTQA